MRIAVTEVNMKLEQRVTFVCILFLVLGASIFAQDDGNPELQVNFEPRGLRTYTLLGIVPAPTGVDALLSLGGLRILPGLPTSIDLRFGGGFERNVFFRNVDGTPYSGPYMIEDLDPDEREVDAELLLFDTAGGMVDFGIDQGLAEGLDTFLYIRSFYRYNLRDEDLAAAEIDATPADEVKPDDYQATIFRSNFPDKNEVFSNALFVGFSYDAVRLNNRHKTQNGFYAETSLEWGPGSLHTSLPGRADYFRLNPTFRTTYPKKYIFRYGGPRHLIIVL